MTTRACLTIACSLAVLAALAATAGPGAGVAAAQPPEGWCAPQDQYKINISQGTFDCPHAYNIASAYNLTGEKYQDIAEFTCYSANSQLAPLLFQCVSNTSEFGVYGA